jgi:hypothetical protein
MYRPSCISILVPLASIHAHASRETSASGTLSRKNALVDHVRCPGQGRKHACISLVVPRVAGGRCGAGGAPSGDGVRDAGHAEPRGGRHAAQGGARGHRREGRGHHGAHGRGQGALGVGARGVGLESRRLESRPKAAARLVLDVSAGRASPSSCEPTVATRHIPQIFYIVKCKTRIYLPSLIEMGMTRIPPIMPGWEG